MVEHKKNNNAWDAKTTIIYVVSMLAVLGVIAFLLLTPLHSVSATQYTTTVLPIVSNNVTLPVLITSQGYAPYGTAAIILKYSSLKARLSNGGWVGAGSGTVNVYAQNKSEVIGEITLAKGDVINQVSFNVTGMQVVVNGATYNVTVPQQQVIVQMPDLAAAQGGAILVGSGQAVSPVYLETSTKFYGSQSFLAVPTITAAGQSNGMGELMQTTQTQQASLSAATPDLALSSAALQTQNGTSRVSVEVTNNGASTVSITGLFVYGTESQTITPVNSSGNSTAFTNLGIKQVAATQNGYALLAFSPSRGQTNLTLTSSGTPQSAYTLAPGGSATFTYSGRMSIANGHINLAFDSGKQYRLVVIGNWSASAATALTAS